jgi:hypothetical protein
MMLVSDAGSDLQAPEARLGAFRRPLNVLDVNPVLRGSVLCAVIFAGAVILAACGAAAQKREAQRLEGVSIVPKTAPLNQRLVSKSEIDSASEAGARRTFLQLWSLLQFQAWDQAEELFEPGLRSAIGDSLLLLALEDNVIAWQATKPTIVSTRTAARTAAITFYARDELGNVIPASISFEGAPGSWHVSFFSMLNFALQRAAQLRAQAQIEPLATKPNAEAIRQGDNAARLQGTYLERKARGETKYKP